MDAYFVELQTALAGRYSLERELGRGGMGVVYLAHEVALDRPVALKFLPPELTVNDEVRDRFVREARTAGKLSHPHIVPIYAVEELDDFVYFAMAAIDGQTLGERVRSRGPLSNAEAIRLLKEVSWALAYAHAQGIVHRDIKPDNILLEEGSGRALLTDFGIAEVGAVGPGTTEDGFALDRATQVVGTAEFMSPEQAKGAPVDGRSDLYSLAIVGFFAVSGRAPFEGGSPSAILGRHVAEPPPPLAKVAPSVSPVIAGVVDRCLRKDPDRRFLGAESVADALAQEAVFERQLPVPLRVFIKNLRRLSQSSSSLALISILFVGPLLVGFMLAEGFPGVITMAGLIGTFLTALLGSAAWQGRKLIKAGFTLEELRLALLEDVNRRNEEIRFDVGPRKTAVDEKLNWIVGGAFSIALLAVLGLVVVGDDVALLWQIFGYSLAGGLTTALVRAHRATNRADIAGERWLKIWGGKLGDWLYRLGGLGTDPPSA